MNLILEWLLWMAWLFLGFWLGMFHSQTNFTHGCDKKGGYEVQHALLPSHAYECRRKS